MFPRSEYSYFLTRNIPIFKSIGQLSIFLNAFLLYNLLPSFQAKVTLAIHFFLLVGNCTELLVKVEVIVIRILILLQVIFLMS